MRKQVQTLVALVLASSLLLAACGGDDDDDASATTGSEPATATEVQPDPTDVPATPEPTPEPTPEATEPASQDAEGEDAGSTTDGTVSWASLSSNQQRVVGGICQAVADSADGPFSWAETWVLSVLAGEAGVPELEEAFAEIPQGPDPSPYVEAAAPICDDIGWTPEA